MFFKKGYKKPELAINTPIFIISFNRKWQLKRSLASYKQLPNIEIIIHDNGSDDTEVLNYLKELEASSVTVYRYPKISTTIELNKVNESIDKYFSSHKLANYIVTDPDVELLEGAEHTLDIYNSLLNKYSEVESVGPMLRIDDIAREYPLYNNVLNRHIEQFWQHKPVITNCNNEKVAFLKCKIDTTFAMHRAGQEFRRLTNGMRLYGRYAARHLDWYKEDVSVDPYFASSPSTIAHWGNADFYKEFKDDKLKFDKYFDIQESEGETRIMEKKLNT